MNIPFVPCSFSHQVQDGPSSLVSLIIPGALNSYSGVIRVKYKQQLPDEFMCALIISCMLLLNVLIVPSPIRFKMVPQVKFSRSAYWERCVYTQV